ncbi:unnamed protein product [Rotaria magnacalcarata]
MTDKKIPLDDALKQITDTLSNHAVAIKQLQENFQPQINTLRDEMTRQFSQFTTNFQELTASLSDLKQLFPPRPTIPPPPPSTTSTPKSTSFSVHSPPSPGTHLPLLIKDTSTPFNTAPTTAIIVPPVSSFPTFSGKPTERPRQFLLQVVEYANTVHHWSNDTLLRGISQFLKDTALEWYCQLTITNSAPTIWSDFVTKFLAQFHSPLRIAQQEIEWKECIQNDTETINEFLVRLRSLWLEQKPHETEPDFIKHLFCKMRPDMLMLMNNYRSSSLEEIIREAQKVEEILYRRQKEQRARTLLKSKTTNAISPIPSLFAQPSRTTSSNRSHLAKTSPTCWRCYEIGHYATQCPLNETKTNQSPMEYQPLPPRSKNQ